MTRKTFAPSPKRKEFIGSIMPACPQMSLGATEVSIGIITACTLHELNIPFDPQQIANVTPSTTTIRDYAIEGAANTHFLARQTILEQQPHLFASADKGASGSFVKKVSFYDSDLKKIVSHTLDCEESGGSSEDCAIAFTHSLRRLQAGSKSPSLRIYGHTTDSGGGGTGHSFKRALLTQDGITCDENEFLVGFCTIHILNLTLSNAIEMLMGQGGLKKDKNGKDTYHKTMLQLLHGLYNLETQFESAEWRKIWDESTNEVRQQRQQHTSTSEEEQPENYSTETKKMKKPIVTRWGTISEGSSTSLLFYDVYKVACRKIALGGPTVKIKKIASGCLELLEIPIIKSDLQLIKAFSKHFYLKHLGIMEKGDEELGGTPGYLSRHMLVQAFLMDKDLSSALNGGWKNLAEYSDFETFENLNDDEKKQQKYKADMFNKIALMAIDKHIPKVWANDLYVYAVFGESETASVVARTLIEPLHAKSSNNVAHPPSYHDSNSETIFTSSKIFNRPIHLGEFKTYIENKCEDIHKQQKSFHVHKLPSGLLEFVADGGNIWSPSDSNNTFKNYFLKCYSGLGSQTQHVESSVKDSNHCGTIGRTETHQTHLAIHRSGLVTKIRELTRKKGEEAHRQKTGRGYNEKNHKMKCKGSSKIFATITVINERFERLNKARQEKSTKS